LKNSLNGNWSGWSVEVRNAERTEYFSLPVDSGQEFTPNANAGSDNFTKNPSSLLIIEDAPVHSVIISHIARKLEFTTTVAPSYEAACKVLRERQFDCVTLDLGLGEHAGLDVLRYLSTIECKAQFIVVSHSDKDVCNDMVELGRALDLNVYDSVQKPIDLGMLRDSLALIQLQSLPTKSAG